MSQDLLQILTGEKPKPKAPKTYDPFDAAVRTVIAEEADPEARKWVAGVIANRLKSGKHGKDFYEVVTAPNQFEPWARGAAQAIDPNSDEYKKVAAEVGPILRGEMADPSGGALNFYNPELNAELAKKDGRKAVADFDDGTGIRVGKTLFFRPGGKEGDELASIVGAQDMAAAEADFAKTFGDPAKWEDKADMTGAGLVGYTKGIEGSLDKAQTALLDTFETGGYIDRNEAPGSIRNPLWVTEETSEKDVPPGAYYVTRGKDATLKRAEGGEPERNLLKSGAQGVSDVMLSLYKAFPGAEDSVMRNRMIADQMAYDAELKGDLLSGAARFTGQAIPSTLALAGGEALAAPALMKSAAGRFLLGQGGGNIITKGASLATRGSLEGAGAAGLVSSTSDAPIGEQLLTGATVGGVLGPILPGVTRMGAKAAEPVVSLVERLTPAGREKAITRFLGEVAPEGYALDLNQYVPGSYPTLGEAAGNAGIAAAERNARTSPKLNSLFQERIEQNAQARRDFFETIAKDPAAITDAKAARDSATATLREAAFKDAAPADAAPVLAKIDEILKSPSGQRDVVVKALNSLKPKLEGQTDVQQLYGIRKALDDMLSPLGPSETKGAQLATRELMEVKASLDKAIEKAAPGFKEYLKTYSEMSKPIDEMELLQGLKLTDQNGNLTLSKVQSAIEKIEAKRKAGGTSKEKSVSAATLSDLKALRDDLKRAANITKGKAPGSDTRQNLSMDALAERGGLPLGAGAVLNAKLPGASFLLNRATAAQGDRMLTQLASRLLQPELSAPVVSPVIPRLSAKPRQSIVPILGAMSATAMGNTE